MRAAVACILAAICMAPAATARDAGPALTVSMALLPLPVTPRIDPARAAFGQALFQDARLSGDGTRSCQTCHDLASNGASGAVRDATPDGRALPFNTPTVFNVGLNFRFGWEGRFRTLQALLANLLQSPDIMAADEAAIGTRLRADPALQTWSRAVYGRETDTDVILDALESYLQTLTTPDSPFDRWLEGDKTALAARELEGLEKFTSFGCVSCHQGAAVGGNLFQRHGIFSPLAGKTPEMVRVPGLRNIAATAPYFHDGSAPTLSVAIQRMGRAQLGRVLADDDVAAIEAFLNSLTGKYRGRALSAP